MTTPHVAFRSSDSLHELTDGYIHAMRSDNPKPDAKRVEAIMTRFIDEAMAVFLAGSANSAGLSPGLQKVVRFTHQTISKATNLVVSRSAKKLDLRQHQAAAEYMDSVRQPAPEDDFWYVAFPISDAMAAQVKNVTELCQQGQTEQARQALTDYLHELTEQTIKWYFQEPLTLLGFGPILKKVALVSMDTTRRTSHSLISHLLPKLNAEQLSASAAYQVSLLVDLPKADAR